MKLTSFKQIFSLGLLLLAGCSSHNNRPEFMASGYLADRGAVRIWRKDDGTHVSRMMTIFTPFNGSFSQTTNYHWLSGEPVAIERHISGDRPDDVTLRFDQGGKLNFMQRQLVGRREPLSDDEVALYLFDAGRMVKISDDLISGRVTLQQGQWLPTGTIKTCQNNEVRPEFDSSEQAYIDRELAATSGPLSIAWLEAPGGTQLLLVSTDDFCKTEPSAKDF